MRECAWEEDDGVVVLLPPRYGSGWLGRRIQRWFDPRPFRVRLDALGTFVWKQCDGRRTVTEITEALRGEFGESVEPAQDRLIDFLLTLVRSRFAALRH